MRNVIMRWMDEELIVYNDSKFREEFSMFVYHLKKSYKNVYSHWNKTFRKASIHPKLDFDKNCGESRKLPHYNAVYLKKQKNYGPFSLMSNFFGMKTMWQCFQHFFVNFITWCLDLCICLGCCFLLLIFDSKNKIA